MRNGALAFALLSLFACGGDHRTLPAPTSPTAALPVASLPAPLIVRGVVLDFQTAKPIPGAVVGFATSFPSGILETSVTDGDGRYSLPEPPPRANNQRYEFVVDNTWRGSGFPRASTRADLAVDRGSCIARYGLVLDSQTFAPIVGATARNLSNQLRATTDKDGWYHIDFGCGVTSLGFNTTWHIMSHPDYKDGTFLSGRGISGNYREDVLLTRK